MTTTEYPFYLGEWKWPEVTCTSKGRVWFDRALAWQYGYNHEEAVMCYDMCIEADKDCGMAHWLKAYCMGPNYNCPWDVVSDDVLRAAREELDNAERVVNAKGQQWEKDMIGALRKRYQAEEKPNNPQAWDIAFADALNAVADKYPDNVDLNVIAAESYMAITPWKMWSLKTGEMSPPPARTKEALARLEHAHKVFTTKQDKLKAHLGYCHFYIHLMEMSPHPEKALKHYDLLSKDKTIGGNIGHLVHMGTHVGFRCGEYIGAIEHNKEGAKYDEEYVRFRGKKVLYIFYFVHNLHFMMYGAMFAGQYKAAMDAAEKIWWLMDDETLQWMGPWGMMGIHVEAFKATKYHAMIRFGKWDEILAEEFPKNKELNCTSVTTLHYARALAFALGKNDLAAADKEMALFEETYTKVPKGLMGRTLHNNTATDLLDVNRVMMKGEVEFRRGNHEEALKLLHKAVQMEDALPYDEPWGIMQPTRHALGALLLEAGKPKEALEVYRQDLGILRTLARSSIHPDNLWSMLGVVDCMKELKQEVEPDFQARLDALLVRADTDINASCFCRLSKVKACGGCKK
eukprot:TRINITY_DN539_c0_g1_i1.p1 TRINITY_DN539_c0_g1~~TRINITY_DN539_c0_g1_i1.p1  ORF type:complete len:572 (+),score=282.30 TRINITY_DN539_c0_g1_i1:53-1768(+)